MNPLGNNGNSADFSQRHAPDLPSDDDVESIVKLLRRFYPYGLQDKELGFINWKDDDSVNRLRESLRDASANPEQTQNAEEPEGEPPVLSKSADDKFWGSGEYLNVLPKKLRKKGETE